MWWHKAHHAEENEALKEVVAAFEQETGKQVEITFVPLEEQPSNIEAAFEARRPPDIAFGFWLITYIPGWALDYRLLDLTDTVGHFSDLFDPKQLDRALLLNARTGRKAMYGLPMGQISNYIHVWKKPAGARGPRLTTFPRSGSRSGRSGAPRSSLRSERHWAATTSGASAGTCRSWPTTPQTSCFSSSDQLFQFIRAYDADHVTRDGKLVIDDPKIRQRLVKAIDAYAAIYRKRLHPARCADLGRWRQQSGVPRCDRHHDDKRIALDSQRAQGRAFRRLLQERRDDRMVTWSLRRDLPHRRRYPPGGGVQGRGERRHRQGVRSLPCSRGLAHTLSQLFRRAHAAVDPRAPRPTVLARPDRHHMAAAMQAESRPLAHDYTAASGDLRHDQIYNERVWASAIHRIVTESIAPAQAVDEATLRIKQILSE